jgi:hypothetical protein
MEGAAGKRKDLMNNIKSRLNAGSYNVEKYYKKNEKDLKDKVKFFEKKIAAGEMKPFMSPRFEQAKVMLGKLMAMKGMPSALAAPAPAANLNAPLNLLAPEASLAPAASLLSEVVVSAPKKARTYRKKTVNALPLTVGEPPAALNQPLRIRIPTTRRGRPKTVVNSLRVRKPFESMMVPGAKLTGITEVSSANEAGSPLFAMNAAANAGSLALPNLLSAPAAAAQKPYNPFNSPAGSPASVLSVGPNVGQSRRRRMPQVMNEHLLKAISESQHLIPEMYDPYTGLKFGPDESPMEKIEQAYRELQKLRANTWKKASTYRRKATGRKGGRRH